MYPNSALSAGQLALIAVVAVIGVTIWIGSVFLAAREPRRRKSSAETAPSPRHPAVTDEPQRKAA
jgi:hypothetical protein